MEPRSHPGPLHRLGWNQYQDHLSRTQTAQERLLKNAVYKGVTRAIARTLRTPPYLILFVSDSCWMKCKHCWFNEDWKEENLTDKRSAADANGLIDRADLVATDTVDYGPLSFDELERMASSFRRIAFLTLTGGEAFIRKDIVEIAAMFARSTKLMRYQIPTSGFVTDLIVRKTEEILRRNEGIPFRVDVSMDGTRETHDRIRAVEGGFDRLCETVRALRGLKRRYPWFDVGVITTVSGANQHEVEDIAEVAQEINPDGEWMVNVVRGKPRDDGALDVDAKRYIDAHKLIAKRIEAGVYGGHGGHRTGAWLSAKNATRRKMIQGTLEGTRKGGGCSAGALAGVIYSDGSVRPCELLEHSLGNVRDFDYDFGRLWNSKQADDVRRWIQDTRCSCTQECFLSMDVLIQPQWWPTLLRERLRLRGSSRKLPGLAPSVAAAGDGTAASRDAVGT